MCQWCIGFGVDLLDMFGGFCRFWLLVRLLGTVCWILRRHVVVRLEHVAPWFGVISSQIYNFKIPTKKDYSEICEMTTTDILRGRIEGKTGVIGATCITRSGLYFDFVDPQPDQITIEDIAWGLSQTCRFGGQCLEYYSVAQHSILVSQIVPHEHRLAGLMHDAAEAYIGDMVGPLKQLIPDFKVIEKRIEAVIFAKFGIALPLDPSIKHADLRLLRTEQRDLTAGSGENWNGLDRYAPLPFPIRAMKPLAAFVAFLSLWDSYNGNAVGITIRNRKAK